MSEHRLQVPAALDRTRADKVVATLLGLSRAEARAAFDEGGVTEGEEIVAPADRLPMGAELTVRLEDRPSGLRPVSIDFGVAYEDGAVVVVDKPPGLVVHPGAGHQDDTLVNGLVHAYPELLELGEAHRWGLVHRLDRETSGLLMVGRTVAAYTSPDSR